MVKPHTSDIRTTCKYIGVTYRWHTSTYEWDKSTYNWHTNDIWVHIDKIRAHTNMQMTWEWQKKKLNRINDLELLDPGFQNCLW